MAQFFTDFDEYTTGSFETNATDFTVQATPGGDWTNTIVDIGGGDNIARVTRTSSSAGVTILSYTGISTTGDLEVVTSFTIGTTWDDQSFAGACLAATADNRVYAIRRNGVDLWRLGLVSAAGGNTTSIGSNFSMANPAAGTVIWTRIGRSGSNIRGKIWTGAAGDEPGTWAWDGAETTLTTLRPAMYALDQNDAPFDFSLFGAGSAGDSAPTSDGGGGGTVNTEVLDSTITVTDEPLDYVFYNRALDSSVVMFDEFIATLVGTISRILTDTLTVDDGAVLFYRRNRLLADTIVVTEGTLEQFTTTNIVIDDTLDVVDSVIRYAQFNRLGTDSLVITDSLISALINYVILTSVLSSTIEVTDDEDHFIYVTRLVESALGVFDESQSQLLRFILLTDTLSVDDSATATYVPDPGTGQVFNPVIRIGYDQPRIEIGGYGLN